ADPLEHAQLHHDPDGWIRLRAKEGRPGLEEVAAVAITRPRGPWIPRRFPACLPGALRLKLGPHMVHHIVLLKLKPEVTPARIEEMMMNTRMQLLKIPEVLSIKCGKRINPELPWPFFIAIDFESMDGYGIFSTDLINVNFMEE